MLIRSALPSDLPQLVALYAEDSLGQSREAQAVDDRYRDAFRAIDNDPNHILALGAVGERVVATLLLSFIPGLSRHGAWRAQIEAMRVARDQRNLGLGQQLLDWAETQARARGCSLIQLTSDTSRTDAHRFYERAGFTASHIGFKRNLGDE